MLIFRTVSWKAPFDLWPILHYGTQVVRDRERSIEERLAAGMTMPDWVKAFLAGDRVKYIP